MVQSRIGTQAQLIVLPPTGVPVPKVFRNLEVDNRWHDDMLGEVQRFRGRVYAQDGAIQATDLTPDGRHRMEIDARSWHVVSLDQAGRICACLRYLEERNAKGFDDLWVRHAAVTDCPTYGPRFRQAVGVCPTYEAAVSGAGIDFRARSIARYCLTLLENARRKEADRPSTR